MKYTLKYHMQCDKRRGKIPRKLKKWYNQLMEPHTGIPGTMMLLDVSHHENGGIKSVTGTVYKGCYPKIQNLLDAPDVEPISFDVQFNFDARIDLEPRTISRFGSLTDPIIPSTVNLSDPNMIKFEMGDSNEIWI